MSKPVTLCIIDDIQSVVDGIASRIPWGKHDIQVVGTALDGAEGLRVIHEQQPDIVLTDIRMPHMNGIEMLTKLKEEACSCKVIFITGYTDFEYTQQAVRQGAFDYVTKPHSIAQILDTVLKARELVLKERQERQSIASIKQKVKESLPVLRQEFFNLLLHHPSNLESVQRRWEFLQIDLAQTDLSIMAIEIDQLSARDQSLPIEDVELIRFSLQNIMEETINRFSAGITFRETMSRFVAIYQSAETVDESRVAELCCDNIAAYTKFTVSIGHGRKASDVSELARAYQEAIYALSYRIFAGGNVVLMYEDVAPRERMLPRFSTDKQQELTMYLRTGNAEESLQLLEDIFSEWGACIPLPEPMYLISLHYELASFMIGIFLEKMPYQDLQELEHKLRVREGTPLAQLKELQSVLRDICKLGCNRIETRQRSESQQLIHEAVQFVRAHLDMELTLNECAKQVHLSGNYFANLFKKVTGLTFIQFVTQERIEASKKMLLEGKQVQDIAIDVGYDDRRYFSDVFKKHTGLTPSEFKQRYSKVQ
jgi:two-component system response regulator YesN